jgi:hypothetical protein
MSLVARRSEAVEQSERVYVGDVRFGTWASVVLALSLTFAVCDQTRAQGANTTQLQKEAEDLKAQLNALEGKINLKKASAPRTPAASDKPSQPVPPSISPDTKLHLGGVTITPGGFLELDGIARQRGQ